MREIGPLPLSEPFALLAIGIQVLTNLSVDLGMILELTFFLLYLLALSWLDLSYLLPITASNYLLTTLLAGVVLHEAIDLTRWAGTAVIAIGVLLVGLSDLKSGSQTAHSAQTHE